MKITAFAFLFLMLPFFGFSQTSIKVKESSQTMSKGGHNAFEVEIPQSSAKDIEHDWKRRLNAGSKAKLTETNGEIAVRGWEDKEIAQNVFNVYSIIASTPAGVKLTVWFTYNDTTFFSTSSGKQEATLASRFVRDFAAAEYYLTIKNLHQKERDKLDKLKDDLEKNMRLEEKSNLKVTEDKRAIARAQDDLATNDNDQKEATANITLQEAEVTKARAGNAEVYKAATKSLEEQQDAKKKLQSRAEDLHKKIDGWNKEIAAESRDVATAKQGQAQATDAITKQKLLLKDLEAKLKAIR